MNLKNPRKSFQSIKKIRFFHYYCKKDIFFEKIHCKDLFFWKAELISFSSAFKFSKLANNRQRYSSFELALYKKFQRALPPENGGVLKILKPVFKCSQVDLRPPLGRSKSSWKKLFLSYSVYTLQIVQMFVIGRNIHDRPTKIYTDRLRITSWVDLAISVFRLFLVNTLQGAIKNWLTQNFSPTL